MVDEKTATTEIVGALDILGDKAETVTKKVADAFDHLLTNTDKFGGAMASTNNIVGIVAKSYEHLEMVLKQNHALFGAASVLVAGATEEYKNFDASLNVSDKNLNTFSGSMKALKDSVENSPFGKTIQSEFLNTIKDLPGAAKLAHSFIGQTAEGAKALATQFLVSADNGLRLQNALLQVGSASGQVNTIISEAGLNLDNMAVYSEKVNTAMGRTMQVTKLTTDQVANYTMMLANMPGGLESATAGTDTLNSALLFAKGSGQDASVVLKQMTETMKSFGFYGDSGAKTALDFSAKISEMTGTIKGANIGMVSEAMGHLTNRYKDYVFGANDAKGISESLGESLQTMAKRFEDVHVPAAQAIALSDKLITSLKGLSIGQESLLSRQMGGAGGIKGAIDVEAMMQEKGGLEKVEKAREDAMKRMAGGNILTLGQAKESGQEEKFFQQRQMLMQGPFKMAETKEEANQVMEMMSKGRSGEDIKKALEKEREGKTEKEVIDRGAALVKQTTTPISEMNVAAQMVRLNVEQINLGGLQDTMAAASSRRGGTGGGGAGISTGLRSELNAPVGSAQGTAQENVLAQMGHVARAAGQAKDILISVAETAGYSKSNQPTQEDLNTRIQKHRSLEEQMGQAAGMTPAQANLSLKANHPTNVAAHSGFDISNPTGFMSAGKQVGAAIHKGDQTEAATAAGGAAHPAAPLAAGAGGPVPVTLTGPLMITFTGKCIHCGSNTTFNEQAHNPGGTTTPQH